MASRPVLKFTTLKYEQEIGWNTRLKWWDAWQKKKKESKTVVLLPVSQMASLSFLPPMLTIFTLKSTPEGNE